MWHSRIIQTRKNGTLNFAELCKIGLIFESTEQKFVEVDGIKTEISELIKGGENERVEFKSSLS